MTPLSADYPPDAMARPARDINVARRADRHVVREIDLRGRGRAAVARGAGRPGAGEGRDHPVTGRHFPHAVVVEVRDVEVAGAVHRDILRPVQLRGRGRAAVAAESRRARPCHRGDHAGARRHFPDALVAAVGDVEMAGAVHRYTEREIEPRLGRRAVVAAEPRYARPRDRRDHAVRRHPADAVIIEVGEVEVAAAIECHADRAVELRGGGRATVPGGA